MIWEAGHFPYTQPIHIQSQTHHRVPRSTAVMIPKHGAKSSEHCQKWPKIKTTTMPGSLQRSESHMRSCQHRVGLSFGQRSLNRVDLNEGRRAGVERDKKVEEANRKLWGCYKRGDSPCTSQIGQSVRALSGSLVAI